MHLTTSYKIELVCVPIIVFLFLQEYVTEIFDCLTNTPRAELKAIADELNNSTPEPRYHMMECEDGDEAIAKYKARQSMETVIVPPTCTGNYQ